MNYAIIGFGKIGQALAKVFARHGIEVAVATTRAPERFADTAAAIGPTIRAATLADALRADVVLLAVRFDAHREVAKALPSWQDKTIVDVTNAYGVPPEQLGGQPSVRVVAQAFAGARLVKGFNHLGASALAQEAPAGGRRVVFLSSDDDAAAAEVGELAERLGFAPIQLGAPDAGGRLVHGSGTTWGHLIFKDLVRFG